MFVEARKLSGIDWLLIPALDVGLELTDRVGGPIAISF